MKLFFLSYKKLRTTHFFCISDLEDMEGLKLYVSASIDEHLHHDLEIVRIVDVQVHSCEVVPIQQ